MNKIMQIVKIIDGKKTYIMLGIGVVIVIAQVVMKAPPHMGNITIAWTSIWSLWAMGAGAALRSAMSKMTPNVQYLVKIASDVMTSKTITSDQIKAAEGDIQAIEQPPVSSSDNSK
jgi:hypothetical protein